MEILAKPRRPLASSGRKDTVISVIIPVYNRFQYLDQALISVFAQTPGPGEVIIVDDCSTESLQKVGGMPRETLSHSSIAMTSGSRTKPKFSWIFSKRTPASMAYTGR